MAELTKRLQNTTQMMLVIDNIKMFGKLPDEQQALPVDKVKARLAAAAERLSALYEQFAVQQVVCMSACMLHRSSSGLNFV